MCGRITQKSNPKVLALKIAMFVEPVFDAALQWCASQEHWLIRQHGVRLVPTPRRDTTMIPAHMPTAAGP
jgi:hypothetical protein